jgi:DNA-binding NarL/FixJ family response regulator
VLNGLEQLLSAEKDCKVLALCQDGEDALRAVYKHRPDILVLDIKMPQKSGLVVLQEMREKKCSTRVVLLTAALEEAELVQGIRLGAKAVVLKDMAPQMIVECVRKVHAGEQWFDQGALGRILERLLRREAGQEQVAGILRPREMEIVRSVAAGLRNKQIAQKLFISEGTVKVHLHNIYEKLGVTSRLQLISYAQEKGLV